MGINAERIKTFQEVGVMSDKKERKELQEKLNRELNEEIDMKKFWQEYSETVSKGIEENREFRAKSLQKAVTRVSC
jgi:Ca2+-binding EF-hand superfamily protein